MKTKVLLTMVVALFFSVSAWAQTTVATMKTAIEGGGEIRRLFVAWTGGGTITVNGEEWVNRRAAPVTIPADQTITLVAIGTVKLTSLECGNSQLTELTLSDCPDLTGLYCDNNQLTELDLSNSSNLKYLHCSNNQLTSLDIQNCTPLINLRAHGQSISVSKSSGSYLNPISYTPKSGTENIRIGGPTYAVNAILPNPTNGNTLAFTTDNTASSESRGYVFSGLITLVDYTPLMPEGEIATMKTAIAPGGTVSFDVTWEDEGTITANGVALANGSNSSVSVPANQTIILAATGTSKLTHLRCYDNQLTELNLSDCPNLTSLGCLFNQLTELDLSNCPNLTYLSCVKNQLTELDLSPCPNLTSLDCSSNQLTELNLSPCPKLEGLDCPGNQLAKLELSPCSKLKRLDCSYTQLTELDLSPCENLITLHCNYNQLTELDLSPCPKLDWLHCFYNQLTKLNLSNCSNLMVLSCNNNQLIELDISQCPAELLWNFYAGNQTMTLPEANAVNGNLSIPNPLKYNGSPVTGITGATLLDGNITWSGLSGASGNVEFTFLTDDSKFSGTVTQPWVYNNPSVGTTIVTMETTVQAVNLQLEWEGNGTISVNGKPATNGGTYASFSVVDGKVNLVATGDVTLTVLRCNENQLTALYVSECTALTRLDCSDNPLTNLDVSKNTELTELYCGRNLLTNLDVTKCTALEVLLCNDNQLLGLDVSGCTALKYLGCSNNQLANLDASKNTALMNLQCYKNRLTSLNVSGCTALEVLLGNDNQLLGLDVSGCTALKDLGCSYNQLANLDVSKNTALTSLGCENNLLTNLDISKCPKLTVLYAFGQSITLSQVPTTGSSLTIANPITYNGSKVAYITGATYGDGNITWLGLAGASGEAQFTFEAELPDGVNKYSRAFSGTVTQPWVNNNPSIVVEEPDPVGEDGKGSLDFSLEIPADATITGTFEIKLPEGYTLDESATKLIEALAGHFDLVITFKEGNIWQIEIKSNGLRAATAATLTKIMDIAYTVDPATPKGKYDIEISHIELDLSDGTSINNEAITVTTEVIYSTTGIDDLQAAPQIWSAGGQVHILLPEATNVQVVNLVGVTVYKAQLSAGAHSVALSKGVYIVRAGSAVRKLRMEN